MRPLFWTDIKTEELLSSKREYKVFTSKGFAYLRTGEPPIYTTFLRIWVFGKRFRIVLKQEIGERPEPVYEDCV